MRAVCKTIKKPGFFSQQSVQKDGVGAISG